jgi:hypothetical protein
MAMLIIAGIFSFVRGKEDRSGKLSDESHNIAEKKHINKK